MYSTSKLFIRWLTCISAFWCVSNYDIRNRNKKIRLKNITIKLFLICTGIKLFFHLQYVWFFAQVFPYSYVIDLFRIVESGAVSNTPSFLQLPEFYILYQKLNMWHKELHWLHALPLPWSLLWSGKLLSIIMHCTLSKCYMIKHVIQLN